MTNITLSIDNGVYRDMKKFSEIKWSEFVRRCIQQRIKELCAIGSGVYSDEGLLAENWLSEEDNVAWENL